MTEKQKKNLIVLGNSLWQIGLMQIRILKLIFLLKLVVVSICSKTNSKQMSLSRV